MMASPTISHADTISDLLDGSKDTEAAVEKKVITTKSTKWTDPQIQKRLRELYAELDNLSGLTVAVNKSVVTLTGEVPSSAEKEKAVGLAKQVEGVVEVEDELTITRSVEKRLETTGNKVLELSTQIIGALPLILVALLAFVGSWSLGGWISRRQGFFRHFTPNAFIANLIGQIVHLMLIVAGLVLALYLLDATALLGTIMGAAGIFGLAIGFAVRDTVENYIASILLSLRNPFQINDYVEINGNAGNVARLTTRATILITPDGNHVRIPNAEVFKAVITNYTRNPERRFSFDLGVDAAQDLHEAQQLAVNTLMEMEGVLNDPKPTALIQSLGDFNIIIRVYGWVNQKEFSFGKVNSEAIRITKQAFDNANIVMPEPIYQIRLSESAALLADEATELKPTYHQHTEQPSTQPAEPPIEVAADLTPDDTALEQIEEERASSDNENLLDNKAPSE